MDMMRVYDEGIFTSIRMGRGGGDNTTGSSRDITPRSMADRMKGCCSNVSAVVASRAGALRQRLIKSSRLREVGTDVGS